MATYVELLSLFSDQDLHDKVTVAVIVSAGKIVGLEAPFATPTAEQTAWASFAFNSPRNEGKKAVLAVLAANRALDVGVIQAATDAAIQTQVDAVVPILAGG